MSTYDRAALLILLDTHLGETDLRIIIFGLGEDFTNFGGPDTPKRGRLLTLLEHCERRPNGLATLFSTIHQVRPDIPLPAFTPLDRGQVDPCLH